MLFGPRVFEWLIHPVSPYYLLVFCGPPHVCYPHDQEPDAGNTRLAPDHSHPDERHFFNAILIARGGPRLEQQLESSTNAKVTVYSSVRHYQDDAELLTSRLMVNVSIWFLSFCSPSYE